MISFTLKDKIACLESLGYEIKKEYFEDEDCFGLPEKRSVMQVYYKGNVVVDDRSSVRRKGGSSIVEEVFDNELKKRVLALFRN